MGAGGGGGGDDGGVGVGGVGWHLPAGQQPGAWAACAAAAGTRLLGCRCSRSPCVTTSSGRWGRW